MIAVEIPVKTRNLLMTLLVTGALGFSAPLIAQDDELNIDDDSPVKRIVTIGEDGGEFFVVKCKSGKEGSVARYEQPRQVCAAPPEECRPAWILVHAAEYVCRN